MLVETIMHASLSHAEPLPLPSAPPAVFLEHAELAAHQEPPLVVRRNKWTQSTEESLLRRVAVLERFLGTGVENVSDLLVVQSVVLSRQECALRAIRLSNAALPEHLVNPLDGLQGWRRH